MEVWGQKRVGVRLSPSSAFNDMHDSNPTATFSYVVRELSRLGIGYLHIIEPRIRGNVTIPEFGWISKTSRRRSQESGVRSQESGNKSKK
jgi:N-ethylmaleimide reductase